MFHSHRGIFLLVSVFITGMSILIIEILAIRILAPYFGNSIFTFSSVIGIILAALSIGYYVGGRFSDRWPSFRLFYGLILLGGITVLLIQLLNLHLLPVLGYKLSMINGPLVTSILLFLVPAFLLGMLSPYAINLLHIDNSTLGIGRVSGLVFFWSTLGSIIGSLGAGFLLIPYWGVSQIVIGTGVLLSALGFLGLILLRPHKKPVAALLALLAVTLLVLIHYLIPQPDPDIVYQNDGLYEQLTVQDIQLNNRATRILLQDRNVNSGMYLDNGRMAFDYTRYFDLYRLFTPGLDRALAIGGGAYSVPKAILRDHPSAYVDVAEIEPDLLNIAHNYFGLPHSERLDNHIMDGRRYLYETRHRYDLIFMDVYRSFAAVPMQFATREFFELARNKLDDDGVFIANYFSSLAEETRPVILSVYKTMETVFPILYVFATIDPDSEVLQNFIYVGLKKPVPINAEGIARAGFVYPELGTIPEKLYRPDPALIDAAALFTDDYAPVEYLAGNVIRRYVRLQKPD